MDIVEPKVAVEESETSKILNQSEIKADIEAVKMPNSAEVEMAPAPAPALAPAPSLREKDMGASALGPSSHVSSSLPSRKRPLRSLSKGNKGVSTNGASSSYDKNHHANGVGGTIRGDLNLFQEDSSDSSNLEFDLIPDIVLPSTSTECKLPDQSNSEPAKFQTIDAVPVEARPLMPVIKLFYCQIKL